MHAYLNHFIQFYFEGEPILLEEPRDIDVKFGNTVYFRCRAEFFGRNPKIVWLQNK